MICLCGRELVYDELGLNKKYNAGKPPLCMDCLAKKLDVQKSRLAEKIEEFRRAGCLDFSRRTDT